MDKSTNSVIRVKYPTKKDRPRGAAKPPGLTKNLGVWKPIREGWSLQMTRSHRRQNDQLRPVTIERGFVRNSPGSVLYRSGETAVLVTASISDSVPPFLEGKSIGWLTAEYSMLPGSTPTRIRRGTDGRATEIQRLLGRSLRAVVDRQALGPWTIHIDADVFNADGGTRTAAITAAFVAVVDAVRCRFGAELCRTILKDSVAAVALALLRESPSSISTIAKTQPLRSTSTSSAWGRVAWSKCREQEKGEPSHGSSSIRSWDWPTRGSVS